MTLIKLGKKFLKIAGISIGTLVLLLALFYWWFIHHAERAISEVVSLQSNGKLQMQIGKIRYNYGRKLTLQNVTLYTLEDSTDKAGYNFQIKKLELSVKSIRSLIFDKQLLIDSIMVQQPLITITQQKKSEARHMSIPEEMGKIYESIEKALKVLEISRFQVDDAQFTLMDKTQPDLQPLTISRLHFHVDNFKVDTTKHKQRDKFLFSDNVVLRSDHQSFMLPDGKHHIAFKGFSINIRNRKVEMDSCTITAYRHHGTMPVFNMFVDTMLLTNVDFLALSRQGLIRADSVYLVNSDIELNIHEDSIVSRKHKKKPLNLQHALSGIASDMQLAYIGVKNSSVQVTTEKDNKTNTFSSSRNNFELYKVVVDTRAEHPITIEQFLMAIRNYDGYGKDSAYRLQFDSIRFTNNTVRLDNFSITTAPGANIDAQRNYHIPLFELKGLSWQDLLFNRHIVAQEAVLHRPVLHYEKMPYHRTGDKRSIYELFTVLDTLLNLRRISMIDGSLDFKLNSNTQIKVSHVNGSVNTDRLLQATSSGFIESAVESLAFSNASITTPHLLINMDRAYFEGGSRSLVIRKFKLNSKEHNIQLIADDLALQDLLLNDSSHLLRIDHISWKKAIARIESKKSKDSSSAPMPLKLFVNGIQLNNTDLQYKSGDKHISAFLTQASAGSIIKNPGETLQLNQLHVKGSKASYIQHNTAVRIEAFDIHEGLPSTLTGINIDHTENRDTVSVRTASLHLTPYIELAGKGQLRMDDIALNDPAIKIITYPHTHHTASHKKQEWPAMEVNALRIIRPDIYFKEVRDSALLEFYCQSSNASDGLLFTHIRSGHTPHNQLTAATAHIRTSNISFRETGKDSVLHHARSLNVQLKDLAASKASALSLTTVLLQAQLQGYENYTSTKGNRMKADSLSLDNLHFNTAWLKEPEQFFRHSPMMSLHHFTGYHISKTNHFTWHNLSYRNKQRELSLDSFSYTPVATRDEFIAAHPYQTDYIQARTGKVLIKNIDHRLYFSDSTLNIHSIFIQDAGINVYRDKRPPFQHGIYKPLPTGLIRKIPFPLSIDTIGIQNLTARYSELSDKTLKTGSVPFTHINATLTNIKNTDLSSTDSMRLRASAMLLDSIGIALSMDESYTDSLQGFSLNVNMSPAHLPVLNPILEPLASIRVRRGRLDTMIIRAVGRDYISLGEMQLYYRGLNIQFLKNGVENKSTMLTRFITWAANHLVLRQHNGHKTGYIYFPRFRDRSVFNYWVKMTLSGAASSVGVKKNRKYIRRYHKALRRNELPPIPQFE
ncbi:MAG: hypothetical protein ACTHMC_19555 [Pseudobacter sp.]|uniref:hypothetical protein n=1 Tax=Pseudobacter sp. TaxID=2045420 RepID=UPI003F822345